MTVWIYAPILSGQYEAAMDLLKQHGIEVKPPAQVRDDDPNRCRIVSVQRMYDLTNIRHMYVHDAMVEHEVRIVADAWRNELRKLVVEAVV